MSSVLYWNTIHTQYCVEFTWFSMTDRYITQFAFINYLNSSHSVLKSSRSRTVLFRSSLYLSRFAFNSYFVCVLLCFASLFAFVFKSYYDKLLNLATSPLIPIKTFVFFVVFFLLYVLAYYVYVYCNWFSGFFSMRSPVFLLNFALLLWVA